MIRNLRRDFAFGARYRESLSASGSIERVNELEYQSIIVASSALPPNKLYLTQKVSYFLPKLTKQFQLRNLWKFAWNHTRNFHRILLRNAIIPKCEIIFLCFQIISSRFSRYICGMRKLGKLLETFSVRTNNKKKTRLGTGWSSKFKDLKCQGMVVRMCVYLWVCKGRRLRGYISWKNRVMVEWRLAESSESRVQI